MSSAELSRGRGGPRCMSMPLVREDLDTSYNDKNEGNENIYFTKSEDVKKSK